MWAVLLGVFLDRLLSVRHRWDKDPSGARAFRNPSAGAGATGRPGDQEALRPSHPGQGHPLGPGPERLWHERWRGFIDERTLLQHHGLAEDRMRQACEWWSCMKSANPNHTSLIRENTTIDRRTSTGTSRRTFSRATTPPSPTPPHCPNGTRPGNQASAYDKDRSENRNQTLKHHV